MFYIPCLHTFDNHNLIQTLATEIMRTPLSKKNLSKHKLIDMSFACYCHLLFHGHVLLSATQNATKNHLVVGVSLMLLMKILPFALFGFI